MKKLFLIVTLLLLCNIPVLKAQEMDTPSYRKGYELSNKDGMLATLARLQKPGTVSPLYQPDDRQLAQMGRRQPGTASRMTANSYAFYGGTPDTGTNVPMAAVTDMAGNTYVTGSSSNENHPAGDFFTLKISPQGAILWEARKPALMYAVESGLQIVLDTDGNPIVAGMSWNGTDMDISLIKYTATGVTDWSTTYNSPFEGLDVPSALQLDATGNVCLTGISWSGDSIDYLTLKYTASGALLWARRHGAGAETWNEPTALTTDGNGNVIVTGYSPNPEGWLNYHTIKYAPDGAELWTQGYNYASADPENPSDVTNSLPRAITTDINNNIYITGTFDTFLGRMGTIKYTPTGTSQWVKTYKSDSDYTQARQIGIRNGALYVAGNHNGGFSNDGNVLASYDLDGNLNWVQETTDLIDSVNVQLLFDSSGNPVVAAKGMTPGTEEWSFDNAARAKKYSPLGVLLGEAAFVISSPEGTASMGPMAGMGLDSAGMVYLTVNSYYTADGAVYETVKSGFGAATPVPDWNSVYTNLGGHDASMLRSFGDSDGNTYSTGAYYTFADGMLQANYFLTKHDATGQIGWEKVFHPGNGNAANGIMATADPSGNLLMCLLPDVETPTLLKLKKYNAGGTLLWEADKELYNPDIRVFQAGADGSVYLGGTAFENDTAEHSVIVAAKFAPDGSEAWTTFTGNGNAAANLYQMNGGKTTANGDLILTGASGTGDFSSQTADITVAKITASGSVGWVTLVPVTQYASSGTDVVEAADGSIYLNGFGAVYDTGMEDIMVAKLNATGTLQWQRQFGAADRMERSYTIKRFSTGAVGVVGYSLGIDGEIHNVLVKYDPEGTETWNFNSDSMRYYRDFHIDGSDVCYIMDQAAIDPFPHRIYNSANPFPIASLITVDATGTGDETYFVGPEYSEFYAENLIPHTDDRLLIGGSVANESFFQGLYFFESVHDGSLGVTNPGSPQNHNALGQNYPNPATGSTTIPIYLTNGGKASLRLYDSRGRLVTTIATMDFPAGASTVLFDTGALSPGVYFYQVVSGNFRQARKMVVTP